jgi:DNA-directed RNA polymerase specialized sigma24 family protein
MLASKKQRPWYPCPMQDQSHRAFPDTNWTLMQRLRSPDSMQRGHALDELCKNYWPPLYAFARSLGQPPHDAEDQVQGFLAMIIRNDGLQKVTQDKGHLRTFLKHAFRNHAVKTHRDASRQKRGGGAEHFTLDIEGAERDFATQITAGSTPDAAFDRLWMHVLLTRCLRMLREHYHSRGKADLFDAMEPLLTGDDAHSGAQIAERLGLNAGSFRVALKRLRDQFRDTLRQEVASTLAKDEDVEEELRSLLALC